MLRAPFDPFDSFDPYSFHVDEFPEDYQIDIFAGLKPLDEASSAEKSPIAIDVGTQGEDFSNDSFIKDLMVDEWSVLLGETLSPDSPASPFVELPSVSIEDGSQFVSLSDICPIAESIPIPECLSNLDNDASMALSDDVILEVYDELFRHPSLSPMTSERYLDLFYQKLLQLFLHNKNQNLRFSSEVIHVFSEVFSIKDGESFAAFNFLLRSWMFDDSIVERKNNSTEENLAFLKALALEIKMDDVKTFQPEWLLYYARHLHYVVNEILKSQDLDLSCAEVLLQQAQQLTEEAKGRINRQEPLAKGFKSTDPAFDRKFLALSRKIEALKKSDDYAEPAAGSRKRGRSVNPGKTKINIFAERSVDEPAVKKVKTFDHRRPDQPLADLSNDKEYDFRSQTKKAFK